MLIKNSKKRRKEGKREIKESKIKRHNKAQKEKDTAKQKGNVRARTRERRCVKNARSHG